jgi:hypothetical protein
MARGVTDMFQEDLNSMVGGGINHLDDGKNSQPDEDSDLLRDEDEKDRNTRSSPTEFDELD